jgi:hypothetical protein
MKLIEEIPELEIEVDLTKVWVYNAGGIVGSIFAYLSFYNKN